MRDVEVLCVDDRRSLLDPTETFLRRESDGPFQYGVSDGGGTGIGLGVGREIVAAHGWPVRCTESESGGARFEVTTVDATTRTTSATEQ